MDLKLKNYQSQKLKSYFKNSSLLLFFNTAKLDVKSWSKTEQILKKLKLKYCKVLNRTTIITFETSVYKNFSFLANNFTMLIKNRFKTTEGSIITKSKNFKNFSLTAVKLNNKIYSLNQVKSIYSFHHTNTVFTFHKLLNKSLKFSSILTNKNYSK